MGASPGPAPHKLCDLEKRFDTSEPQLPHLRGGDEEGNGQSCGMWMTCPQGGTWDVAL